MVTSQIATGERGWSADEPAIVRVIDSHTGGEPTRVVLAGAPDLGVGSMADRLATLREQFDRFRRTVVCEPRGSDLLVGALLLPPVDAANTAGVIFFNNVGYLGMCGHGTIGLIASLAHLGRIGVGEHTIETPVGIVSAHLRLDGTVSVRNVESYRYAANVAVELPSGELVAGDVAWGGNWFFLTDERRLALTLANADALTERAWQIRVALAAGGVTGAEGAEIDHVALGGPSSTPGVDSRHFVLCPGRAYDRSPCGSGTSARLACLYAEGRLRPGEVWRQESIVDSVFEGSVDPRGDAVVPNITGRAYVTGIADLIIDPDDPFGCGIDG